MGTMRYEELLFIVKEEGLINLFDVECVVQQLVQALTDNQDDYWDNDDYSRSARKRLREISYLFDDEGLQIFGNADDFHNIAVNYARQNIYDCACRILKRGVQIFPYSIDILSDLIRYGISGGQFEIAECAYSTLSKLGKDRWNWRAYSFSIDYLIDSVNKTDSIKETEMIKKKALEIANQFIQKIPSDQSYFDKAEVLRELGNDQKENIIQTEESVLKEGFEKVTGAHKCALRMADILFDRGEYKESLEYLKICCLEAFKPQPGINGSYAYLLLAMSKASELFGSTETEDYEESKEVIDQIYRDIHTSIKSGLNGTYRKTADTAIKILEAQTGVDYPFIESGAYNEFDY